MGKEITVNSFSKYRLDRAKQEYEVAIMIKNMSQAVKQQLYKLKLLKN